MSTLTYAVRDSATMLRRDLRHALRYPSMTLMLVGMPIVFLLLFVYVFGGTLGTGLGGSSGGRATYLEYVTPGILLMTVAAAAQGTAISVAMDMTEGIIARFRTMAIFRPSVLTGHVLGSMIQTMLSLAVVVAVALLIGFRPTAGPVEWVGAVGILALITFAVSWLCVALGMVTKTVEAASNLPMPLVFLPFLGSGFVPTDSMPTGRLARPHGGRGPRTWSAGIPGGTGTAPPRRSSAPPTWRHARRRCALRAGRPPWPAPAGARRRSAIP